jgi:hypothetical protein
VKEKELNLTDCVCVWWGEQGESFSFSPVVRSFG